MPAEAMRLGAMVDYFARAAMAEIELREGEEEQLLVALNNCIKLLQQSADPIKP